LDYRSMPRRGTVKKRTLHELFLIGIIVKAIYGILEIIGGITLVFTRSDMISSLVRQIFHHEIVEDPTDFFANLFIRRSHISSGALSFAAVLLIIHGFINICLFVALLHKKRWAFPVAAVALTLLIIYQILKILSNHSIALMFFTLFDIALLMLFLKEYNKTI
jgi:uncharacterized membrane protein